MLPQYLGQTWVNYGYELLLALYAQMAGFGFAGFLRRFLIVSESSLRQDAENISVSTPQV